MSGLLRNPPRRPAYLEYTWRGGWASDGWSPGICCAQKTGLWQYPGQPTDRRGRCLLWARLLFQKTAYSSQEHTGVEASIVPLERSQRKVHDWVVSGNPSRTHQGPPTGYWICVFSSAKLKVEPASPPNQTYRSFSAFPAQGAVYSLKACPAWVKWHGFWNFLSITLESIINYFFRKAMDEIRLVRYWSLLKLGDGYVSGFYTILSTLKIWNFPYKKF